MASCTSDSPKVTVNYAASDGSATGGTNGTGDYTKVNGTLSWGGTGDCGPQSFSVPINDDTTYEGDETVNLNLSDIQAMEQPLGKAPQCLIS
ncbi:MAG: hypothetical protein GY862_20460 [Gammaproteobacteria bacterium]|nr:hypothetical protein [Gammaproteobacteria bacterium]